MNLFFCHMAKTTIVYRQSITNAPGGDQLSIPGILQSNDLVFGRAKKKWDSFPEWNIDAKRKSAEIN